MCCIFYFKWFIRQLSCVSPHTSLQCSCECAENEHDEMHFTLHCIAIRCVGHTDGLMARWIEIGDLSFQFSLLSLPSPFFFFFLLKFSTSLLSLPLHLFSASELSELTPLSLSQRALRLIPPHAHTFFPSVLLPPSRVVFN